MINDENYLSSDNNVMIAGMSSQIKGCNAENVLNSDNKVYMTFIDFNLIL